MNKVIENVREFQSFGDLLQADFNRRLQACETPSIRKYGQELEVDASTLLQTMKKRRKLSGRLIQTIGRKLGLSNQELAYVIETESDPNSNIETRVDQEALMINDWRFDALLEILDGKSTDTDIDHLAHAFQVSVTRLHELRDSLVTAHLLNAVDGLWVDQMAHVTAISNPMETNQAARDYQKSLCETSIQAIDQIPPEKRNHTSVLLKLDENDIPAIIGVLKATRRTLAKDYQSTETPHKNLYALQIALFPLSSGESHGQIQN